MPVVLKVSVFRLLMALSAVESCNGSTSMNVYQIGETCVRDVNRIYGLSYSTKDVYDIGKSKDIAILYLSYWGDKYEKSTGMIPTYETYSRIWNGGPCGWKRRSTLKYWNKVRKVLRKRGYLK